MIPQAWMPKCAMKRVICHWTAGGHRASSLDKAHYHILIEDQGALVQGTHSIEDNVSTSDGHYAAHTRGLNTGSIGVAVCCMANSKEHPFEPGAFPMTQTQWQTMAKVVAELCQVYRIPVTPQTVLGHGEVSTNLGVPQAGKWDPMVLPWAPQTSKTEVGNLFRSLVKQFLENGPEQEELVLPKIQVRIHGQESIGGIIDNENSYVHVASMVNTLGWSLLNAGFEVVVLFPPAGGNPVFLPYILVGEPEDFSPHASEEEIVEAIMDQGYVDVRELAAELNAPLDWDEGSRTVIIGEEPPVISALPSESTEAPCLRYTIKPGDTLSAIAARLLGEGSRWRDILKTDGSPFTEVEARRIQPGMVVFVPETQRRVVHPSPGEAAGISSAGAERRVIPLTPEVSPALSSFSIDALVMVVPPLLRAFAQESIPIILAECRKSDLTSLGHIAYVLATAQHESLCGKFMVELWGPTDAQRRYEGRADLGNIQPGDGFRFRGRGYVQITGRANYQTWSDRLHLDLINQPDLVSRHPDIAAKILVQGMRDGAFRPPHRLSTYLTNAAQDFFNAREIINADKHFIDQGFTKTRGQRIAEIAQNYLVALSRG